MSELKCNVVKVGERTPDRLKIVPVVIDGRLPMMAMYVGFSKEDEWRELNTQKPIKEGITHWLELVR